MSATSVSISEKQPDEPPTHNLVAQSSDPLPVANEAVVYGRQVGNVVQLFVRSDDGTVHQLTPTGAHSIPGGPTNSVQTNDGASGFAGSAGLTFDGSVLAIDADVDIADDIRFTGTNAHLIAGPDISTDGGNSGAMFYRVGNAGASAAGAGGNAGSMGLQGGVGGDANGAAGTAGNGTSVSIDGGGAGSAVAAGAVAGNAGTVGIGGGPGSFALAGNDGGGGGQTDIAGGNGGLAIGGGNGGPGADLNLRGGGGGNGALNGAGANCNLFGGGSSGVDGNVTIGSANTTQVDVGNVADDPPTNFLGAGLVSFSAPTVLASFTVAGVPSASPAGQQIFVTDEVGGAVPAFSDNTNWRRCTDRAIVSV